MEIGSRLDPDIRGFPEKRSDDAALAELAERQHGVISRRQAGWQIGLTTREIEHRIDVGRLRPIHRGVYAVGHRALTDAGRRQAVLLLGGLDSTLSHRSAGALWGIRRYTGREEVTVPTYRRSTEAVRFYSRRLPRDEVTELHGLAVTTAARTVFDLAAVLEPDQVTRAVEHLEVWRLWGAVSIAELLERHPARPGAAALRSALRAVSGATVPTRSELEDRFLSFLERWELPRPAINRTVETRRARYECDCVWAAERVIVELDGYAWHGQRTAFEEDRARDRALVAAGWKVIRATWAELEKAEVQLFADLSSLLSGGKLEYLPPRM